MQLRFVKSESTFTYFEATRATWESMYRAGFLSEQRPLLAQSRRSLSLAMLIPRKEVITLSLSTGDGPQLTEWPFNAFSQSKGMDEPSQLLLRMKQIHRAPVRKRSCG